MKIDHFKILVSILLIMLSISLYCQSINDNIAFSKCFNDTIINNTIRLNDANSFNKYLLKDREKIDYNDWIYFSSKDKKQYIGLQTNYGGGIDEYKQFEISYISDNYEDFIPQAVKEFNILNEHNLNAFSFITSDWHNFITGLGIKLGISENEFLTLMKVRKFSIDSVHNITTFNYIDEDCFYEACYEFKDDKLVKIRFGYITP